MKISCKTCGCFWMEACHRYPPTVSVVMIPQRAPMGLALQSGQQQMMLQPTPVAAFPPIANPEDIWCAEHRPRVKDLL